MQAAPRFKIQLFRFAGFGANFHLQVGQLIVGTKFLSWQAAKNEEIYARAV